MTATYNAMRRADAMPGDLVAVQDIGGLGHLGIQFINKFGYRVAAVGRGSKIESLAMKLGIDVYIDSKVKNAAEELQKLRQACPDRRILLSYRGGSGSAY